MKRRMILFLVVVVVLIVLPSCKKNESITDYGPPLNGINISNGTGAIDFTEMDANGNDFTLSSFRGRVILLNFSTVWCAPCRREAPELVQLYSTYKGQGFEVVQCIYEKGDYSPANRDDINSWIQEFGISYTVVNDPDESSVNAYGFDSIPFNVVIDRDFVVRHFESGFDYNTFARTIEKYL